MTQTLQYKIVMKQKYFIFFMLFLASVILYLSSFPDPGIENQQRHSSKLLSLAVNNSLLVSTTDLYYLPLALNLFYGSFRRLGITNYVIGCTHSEACTTMHRRNIKL